MADIFISYSNTDRKKARAIVRELEKQGWSVWWDRDIPAGQEYDTYIKAQLDAASCIVVLWSKRSIESSWVRAEADVARERRVLVPVRIEDVEVPISFRMIQSASLTEWPRKASPAELERFLKDVGAALGREAVIRDGGRTRAWTNWVVPVLLLVPIPVVATLGYRRVESVDVRLELQLSAVAFVLDGASALLQNPLALTELGVSGLRELELPVATGRRERFTSPIALFSAVQDDGSDGAIGIEVGVLGAGTRIALKSGDFPSEYHLALAGDLPELGASVHGPIHVRVPRMLDRRMEFDRERIGLWPGPGVLGLDLILAGASQADFSPGVPADSLQLFAIPRYGEGELTASPLESTIISGTVHFESSNRHALQLDEGQLIRFAEASGEVRNVELSGTGISMLFVGSVRGMRTGLEETSLMPTVLGSLWSQHAAIFVLLGLVYLLALAAFGYRIWRQQE